MYTTGTWLVKEGREDEFARRWQASADGLSLAYAGVKFMLFRDATDPRRFVSLGEGWRNAEQIESARTSVAFQETMAAVEELLESGVMSTLDLVAEVS
jgi:quinol monooxygenase YgiN